VLLIIFMVATPMIENQDKDKRKVDIDLPVTQENANRIDPEQTDKMILEITATLKVQIGEEVLVDCEQALSSKKKRRFESCFKTIEQKLGANAKLQQDKELYLLADADIPYGFVVGTMARIKKSGISKLGMVTNPEYLEDEPTP
jgi:biopolymer transport protein TolR